MPSAVRAVTFGPAWSRALCVGCASLGVPPEWVLAVLALESGFNPLAKNASGARGLWQRMPSGGVPYAVTDPTQQLRDAFAFWRAMMLQFHVDGFTSREAFYCLNLAPARLRNSAYTPETVLYAAPTAAYEANRNLDPHHTGRITIAMLAPALDAAVARNRARYDAELEAAYAANVAPA